MMDPVTNTTQGNVDDDGGSDTIDSPPRPVRTSSPRHPISSSSSSPLPNMSPTARNNHNSAINNFQKYGSIRPPLSVLQDEFCETYRLWEEHDAILRRVEVKFTDSSGVIMRNFGNKNDRSDWRKFKPRQVEVSDDGVDDHSDEDDLDEEAEWEEAFAHLRTLYSRHHHEYDFQEQPFALGQSCRNKNEFLESLCAIDDDDNDTLEEKLEEVDDNKEDTKLGSCEETDIDNTAEQQQKQQQQRKKMDDIENLTKLFRPGSKFTGTMDVVSQVGSKRTSLVIMEENTCDELGRPKGYLARQKLGSDEQCVFLHVTFVPLSDAMAVMATFDDYDLTEEETITSARPPPQSLSPQDTEERMTIQIEYSDSEKRYWGFWNPNTLSFQGTAHKLDDANDNQGATDRGGLRNSPSTNNVIMSGLISGRAAGTASSSDVGDGSGAGDAENTTGVVTATEEFTVTSALSSKRSKRKQPTFSLSPCTHLHPRGRVQTLWDPFAMSHLVNMMGSDVGFLGLASSVKKRIKVSEKAQLSFMDELASDDNHKLALHRARTEQLLLQTLVKLTELGELIDFAELARKRNIAKRREKWRGRMRKITPRLPRKLKKQKSKQVDSGEEFGVSSFDSVQKNKVQFYDHLAAISWESLLDAASIQAQRTCAIFRHRSSLLDSLTFQSDEYKYQVMSDLRANGLTLASSHSEWDRCIQMGRTVSLGWSWFERGSWGCFERSAVVGRRCVYILFQMHSKLSVCHEQLEKSFRCADARISNARLESFKRVKRSGDKSGDDDSEEVLCGICQCDIDEADGNEEEDSKEATDVVTLLCSHSFHWNCIREWLHDHSQCPLCRIDLNE